MNNPVPIGNLSMTERISAFLIDMVSEENVVKGPPVCRNFGTLLLTLPISGVAIFVSAYYCLETLSKAIIATTLFLACFYVVYAVSSRQHRRVIVRLMIWMLCVWMLMGVFTVFTLSLLDFAGVEQATLYLDRILNYGS